MAITFLNAASPVSGSSVTSVSIPRASSTLDDFLLIVLGFEGVAAGSGPWVVDSSGSAQLGTTEGWARVCYQAPAATGCGLEVWAAINHGISAVTANFASAKTLIAQMFAWSGEYHGGPTDFIADGGTFRAATTEQVSGDNPQAPSIYSFVDELVVVCAADELQSPGYGTPTPAGWTKRDDQKRSAFGNVEITLADKITTVEGDTGSIPWAATAAAAGSKGATATLAVRPPASPPTATSPLIAVEFAVAD
jgi:hypothetical protein